MADYRRLVREVVAGRGPKTPHELEHAADLWDAQRVDRKGFDADCEHLRQRMKWHAQLTGLQAAKDRQDAIGQERAALLAERQRVLEALDAKISALNSEETKLTGKLASAEHARDRLFNTFRDKEIQSRERELSDQSVRLRDAIAAAQQRLAEQVVNPLGHARAALRVENDRTKNLAESGRDPRNTAKLAQFAATMKHFEERETIDLAALAALVAQSGQLQAELRELADLHYQP